MQCERCENQGFLHNVCTRLDAELLDFGRTRMKDKTGRTRARPAKTLVQQDEMIVAVLLPAIFRGFGTNRLLLAIADGLELVRIHAGLDQELLGCVGAVFTQRQVELGRTAVIAAAFNPYFPVRMLADGLGRARQRLLCFGTQIRLVVIEINVGYVLIEKLLLRERRWWWRRRWWRLRYRDGCCGLLSSAFARRG